MKVWKHKDAEGNQPFIKMSYEKHEIDEILDDLIGTDEQTFECHYCGDVLNRNDIGGVLPSDSDEIIYLCKSILCLLEYFDEFLIEIEVEDEEEKP